LHGFPVVGTLVNFRAVIPISGTLLFDRDSVSRPLLNYKRLMRVLDLPDFDIITIRSGLENKKHVI
jgi:hypothetical protein